MSDIQIWKYDIPPIEERFDLYLPEGAKILSVQVQSQVGTRYGMPRLWALVNALEPVSSLRRFYIASTGRTIGPGPMENLTYVDTFQMDEGRFVRHLFEITGDGKHLPGWGEPKT